MKSLRLERPEDAPAVRALLREAFGRADEADLVDVLREAGAPVLAMVAVEDGAAGQVVAHVLYTWVTVDTESGDRVPLLGLAPLAVLPEHQGEGIGTQLVEASLEHLRAEGHAAVVLVGHPAYYPRFGFLPASRWGLRWEADCPDEAFMAIELNPGSLAGVRGVVRFRPEFAGI